MFDKDKLLSHFDNDYELLADIFEELQTSTAETMNELSKAIEKNSFEEIERHAHTVKGACSNFFAQEVVEAAHEIEMMGRNQNVTNIQEKYTNLHKLVQQLVSDLEVLVSKGSAA